jgi:mannitol operon repressor
MPPRDHFEGTPDQVMAMFREITSATDRVAAVACAAFLDDTLGAALAAHFVRLTKKWEDRIFSGATAPLGTFSAKTRIGYVLGLYGPLTCDDLETIRSIRNDFAHQAGPISFDEPEIIKSATS